MLPKKYDKYDRIVVDEKDFERISKWVHNNYETENGAFPLEKGILQINAQFNGLDATSFNVFELHKNYINIEIYDSKEDKLLEFEIRNINGELKYNLKDSFKMKSPSLQAQADFRNNRMMTFTAKMFMQIMYFMANFIEEKRVVREIKPQYQPSNLLEVKPKSTPVKRSIRTIGRTTYRLTANREVLEKRPYERHTNAWTRRGHFRYLKNGNRVWIEPTVVKAKGVKEAEIESATYKL